MWGFFFVWIFALPVPVNVRPFEIEQRKLQLVQLKRMQFGRKSEKSTMVRRVGACGALMRPLVDALKWYVLIPGKAHSNDTPMPVLSPGNGQTGSCQQRCRVNQAAFSNTSG
ncbi:hypothetical protein CR103_21695 [Massilia psychrophila]|uniref:Transposase IS66 central domain-containing protein n=1 Tax=Massilia psychrophila TaxID=1603353 RepID=A0A2G8SVJ6_9BURK|nr:hypothetical protein CR103_21695 [Massilia psychrophila]